MGRNKVIKRRFIIEITEKLFSLKDETYKEFNSKLIPNIDKKTVIGVRTPILRAITKDMIKNGEAMEFIKVLPHKYFEENQLHAFVISEIKDFDEAVF